MCNIIYYVLSIGCLSKYFVCLIGMYNLVMLYFIFFCVCDLGVDFYNFWFVYESLLYEMKVFESIKD